MKSSIYERALGEKFQQLHPLLQMKYGKTSGVVHGEGVMKQIRGSAFYQPAAYGFVHDDFLFPERGANVPFSIRNTYSTNRKGPYVSWDRHFHFPNATRRFYAEMWWNDKQSRVYDSLGKSGRLVQPLDFHVTNTGGLLITSDETYAHIGNRLIRLPNALSAKVNVYEKATSSNTIQIFVHIELVTTVLMYEGEATVEEIR
ncbi:DUF4166 domain-containing protein [Geomicrobium sp. JCM 19055]|uniref:DUF4166 domain-containing protein n=1 Tax=Geomicrobium sp. JCM 19055 TaxID=1460649 RepID=UPI00045ED0EA|nr:DUF4166 domain-containing protein [Geomicrobium sp. JCM 19055]GAK00551.1 hypothetical protein JCM19055_3646 [Geomicrobium sp. JCM 19055]